MTAIKGRFENTWPAAVTRILGQLGDDAAAAIGRSMSLVYQFSNPDSDKIPNVEQALQFDIAFVKAGGASAPIFDVYRAKLDDATRDAAHEHQPPHQRFLRAMAEIGELSTDLHKASADGKISPAEAMKLEKDIEDTIQQLRAMAKDLRKATQHKAAGR